MVLVIVFLGFLIVFNFAVTGYEGPASNAFHPETVHDYFKPMYHQALNAIINAINDRLQLLCLG